MAGGARLVFGWAFNVWTCPVCSALDEDASRVWPASRLSPEREKRQADEYQRLQLEFDQIKATVDRLRLERDDLRRERDDLRREQGAAIPLMRLPPPGLPEAVRTGVHSFPDPYASMAPAARSAAASDIGTLSPGSPYEDLQHFGTVQGSQGDSAAVDGPSTIPSAPR